MGLNKEMKCTSFILLHLFSVPFHCTQLMMNNNSAVSSIDSLNISGKANEAEKLSNEFLFHCCCNLHATVMELIESHEMSERSVLILIRKFVEEKAIESSSWKWYCKINRDYRLIEIYSICERNSGWSDYLNLW